jgi:hypothetical protein
MAGWMAGRMAVGHFILILIATTNGRSKKFFNMATERLMSWIVNLFKTCESSRCVNYEQCKLCISQLYLTDFDGRVP